MSENRDEQDMNPQDEAMDAQDVNEAQDAQSPLEEALQKLAQAEMVMAHQKDEVLRVQAEMQNLRRRTEQDVEKAHKFHTSELHKSENL